MRSAVALASGYLVLQLAAISYGQWTPDHVFGFQMFNESSRLTIHLFRELERRRGRERVLVPIPDGRWRAPDAHGTLHEFDWQDRVRDRTLRTLGRSVHARYGLDAQLFHLQAALLDVAQHIPEDTRTRALVAVVETEREGRPSGTTRLRAERP